MAAFTVFDDTLQSNHRILDIATLTNLILRDVGAILLSKLWTIRGSNNHVQDLELTLEVCVLVELRTLGRIPVMSLETFIMMMMLGLALHRIHQLEVLANLLVRIIFETVVLLAVELEFEFCRVMHTCPHRSRCEQPHLFAFMHTTTMR